MTPPIQLPELPFHRLTPDGYKKDLTCLPEAQLLVMEAEVMGIAWEVVPFSVVVKFTYGGRSEFVRHGSASTNRSPGPYICGDKYQTHALLTAAGIPTSKGFSVLRHDTLSERERIFKVLKAPLVVKPAHSAQGVGVKMGITSLEEMNNWIDHLFATGEPDTDTYPGMVLVEETLVGKEYRIIATRDKLVAVMHRQPASVTGDGVHTIEELIAEKNKDPMRNISAILYPHIVVDEEMIEILASQHLTVASIPTTGQKVPLRLISNIMAGGDAIDVTDEVHPSVADIATRVTRAIPYMTLVGLDYVSTNIANDQQFEQHGVIEVNSLPGYTMHDLPMIGKKRGVARTILQMLFPEWKEPVAH